MNLSFEVITEADIPELPRVMTRAFDDDSRRHLGVDRGGPEGYDNGDFFRKWLFGQTVTEGFKVLFEGAAIGGCIVWIFPTGDNILGTIFIDPDFQDSGAGSAVWKFIEGRYPHTKSWRLATPKFATKNHHFYEIKCGFQRVRSDRILGKPADEFVYRKVMKAKKR
ncbi:MAG: GNAT family N-acetyltransferase [Anaerolineales bacterium]|nr:GNAT family N-acetyltransferase [Anaerolineales bacterium]